MTLYAVCATFNSNEHTQQATIVQKIKNISLNYLHLISELAPL